MLLMGVIAEGVPPEGNKVAIQKFSIRGVWYWFQSYDY